MSWEQKEHAAEWMILPQNIGPKLCIDETSLCEDLVTFVSNKDGHCKKGTIVAAVKGTRVEDVTAALLRIPEEERLKVEEVTLDMSESMAAIVKIAFPNATLVLDCFHVLKRCNDATEELRLKYKREAQVEDRRKRREFKKRQKRNAAQRKRYRKKHPKNYPGKVRGPKPKRKNEKYKSEVLSTGDTVIELLTRTKYTLTQSRDKWTDTQKARMALLFEMFPKLKESYDMTNKLRSIFRSKTLDKESARNKLHDWYKDTTNCTLREVKAARDSIKYREDEVLNYFVNRSTNASAESLNSKIKSFRSQLRGVSDLPFFMYRLSKIFG